MPLQMSNNFFFFVQHLVVALDVVAVVVLALVLVLALLTVTINVGLIFC